MHEIPVVYIGYLLPNDNVGEKIFPPIIRIFFKYF